MVETTVKLKQLDDVDSSSTGGRDTKIKLDNSPLEEEFGALDSSQRALHQESEFKPVSQADVTPRRQFTERLQKNKTVRKQGKMFKSSKLSIKQGLQQNVKRRESRLKWMATEGEGEIAGTTDKILIYQNELLNPHDHIRHLKFTVPIHQIYKFAEHYARNQSSNFCAVLCEVADHKLREMINNQFILKVYTDQGVCVFQRYLDREPKHCALFQNVLVYVCERQLVTDTEHIDDEQVIHLVRFEDNQVVTIHRVGLTNTFDAQSVSHVGFSNNFLFFTVKKNKVTFDIDQNNQEIQIWQIDCRDFLNKSYSEPCQTSHKLTAEFLCAPGMKVHQFIDLGHSNTVEHEDGSLATRVEYRLGVIFEDEKTSTVKFYEVNFEDEESDQPFICLVSLHDQEVESISDDNYYIKKIESRMCIDPFTNKLFQAAAVLKYKKDTEGQGQVDLYYNFRKVNTLSAMYEDIDASFLNFYLKSSNRKEADQSDDSSKQSTIQLIQIHWKEMMGDTVIGSFKMTEESTIDQYWQRNKHYAVQEYVKLYTCFFQLKYVFMVAHDRFLSIFHLTSHRWYHIQLSDMITKMGTNYFPIKKDDYDSHQVNVLLECGKIETLKILLNQQRDDAILNLVIEEQQTRQAPGLVQDHVFDTELNSACLLLCDSDLECQESSELYFSHKEQVNSHQKNCCQIKIPKKHGNQVRLVIFANGKFTQLKKDNQLDALSPKTRFVNSYQCSKEIKEFYLQTENTVIDLYMKFENNLEFNLLACEIYELEHKDGSDEFYKGCKNLQAVIQPTDEKYKDHCYLIADGDLFVLKVVESENEGKDGWYPTKKLKIVTKTNDMHLRNAVSFGDDYIYAVSDGFNEEITLADGSVQKGSHNSPGVYCLDGKAFLVDQINDCIMIRDTLGGVNSDITVNGRQNRFAYIRNFDQIELLPVTHTNLIEYIGMPPPSLILAHRREAGTFSVLTNQGFLYAWSELTAKQVIDRKELTYQLSRELSSFGVDRKLTEFKIHKDSPTQEFKDHSVTLLVHDNYEIGDSSLKISNKNKMKHKAGHKSLGTQTFAAIKMAKQHAEVAFMFKFESFDYRDQKMLNGRKDDYENYKNQITFSPDLQRMLQISNDGHCFIRKLKWINQDLKLAEWETLYQVNNLPLPLLTSNHNTLFTPDFEQHLDVDYNEEEWLIRKTADNSEVTRIPNEIFSAVQRGEKKNKISLTEQAKRMMFMDDKHLRVLSRDNIDVVINFEGMFVQSYCKIDEIIVNSPYKHFYCEGSRLGAQDSSLRLVRCAASFRQEVALHHELESEALYAKDKEEHEISKIIRLCRRKKNVAKRKEKKIELLDQLRLKLSSKIFKTSEVFDEDYKQDTFFAEHSYTLLDWLIIDQLASEADYAWKRKLQGPQLVKLCFNIFPNQKTIWHYIATSKLGANLEMTRALFQESQKEWPEFNNVPQNIPIIRDSKGMAAVDWAFTDEHYNKHFVQEFLANIKDYPIFTYGRVVEYAIVNSVKHDHSGLVEFLDSRLKKFGQFHAPVWSKNKLKKHVRYKITPDQKVTATTTSPLPNRAEILDQLFNKSTETNRFQRREVSTRVFDIPDLHISKTLAGKKFMNALADTEEIDIFSSMAVQVIIEESWKVIKARLYVRRILPYLLYFAIFTFWSLWLIPNQQKDQRDGSFLWNVLCAAIIVGYAIYLIGYHAVNLYMLAVSYRNGGILYFSNMWNYIELIPAVLVLVFISKRVINQRQGDRLTAEDDIYLSLISFFQWVQMWYYMRVRSELGYYVRMIVDSFYDLRYFILIFTLSILAFGQSFFLLGRKKPSVPEDEATYLFKDQLQAFIYSYRAAMGDFVLDDFPEVESPTFYFLWLYWLLITIVALIVLLNLLIAIVSQTFTDVLETKIQNSYAEKARIIRDLQKTVNEPPTTQARFLAVAFDPYLGENKE